MTGSLADSTRALANPPPFLLKATLCPHDAQTIPDFAHGRSIHPGTMPRLRLHLKDTGPLLGRTG
jgi:hypothetical protein